MAIIIKSYLYLSTTNHNVASVTAAAPPVKPVPQTRHILTMHVCAYEGPPKRVQYTCLLHAHHHHSAEQ